MNTLNLMPGARVAPARAVLRGRSVQGAAPRPRAVVRGRRLHARADSEPAKPAVPPVLLNTVPAPAPVHVTCGATLRLPPCRPTANRHAAFMLYHPPAWRAYGASPLWRGRTVVRLRAAP